MRYAISILLLPILFLIGCTADTTAPGSDSTPTAAPNAAQLQANSWLLLELNGRPPVPGTEISLNFDDDGIGGNSGCNVYGGSYELVDGRLTISDIFSTMMACMEEGVMEQEAAFHQALRDAVAFAVSADGQTLELRNADGVIVARLTAADETAEPITELQKEWLLVELNGQPLLADSEITLTFDSEALFGNAGCNGYGSPYTAANGRLTISQLVYHEVYCMDDGIMDQEEAYLAALGAAVAFELSDDSQTLWLRDAEGRAALRFIPRDTANASLQNSWLLIELNGSAPLANREITLNIAADSLGGSGGCNSYGGSYELKDGYLLISEIFSTMMACLEESVMEQETAYFEALNSAINYELADDGQTLLLQNVSGETILRFVAVAPETNAELEGSFWSLTTMIANEAASSLLAGSAITLTFDKETGQISGSAGCNNYFATYRLDGERMEIGAAGATRMFCGDPDGVMEQESQFLTWLEEVEGYAVDGRQLTLTLSDGRALIFTLQ